MLAALLSRKALTARELAGEAGVTLQTASAHLGKLADAGLIAAQKSGRHEYFTLAGDEVGRVLAAVTGLAEGAGRLRTQTGPKDAALREARVCYNHLAGARGIALFQGLVSRGVLRMDGEEVRMTDEGGRFLRGFGVDVDGLQTAKAALCKPCLDWSARQTHLAGSVGRALLARMETLDWCVRVPDTRVVRFTAHGRAAFDRTFG